MAAGERIVNYGRPGIEASMTSGYISSHPEIVKTLREVNCVANTLIETYRNVLSDSEICKAKTLVWGTWSIEEYEHKFLVLILMDTYKVFDESHLRYITILNAIGLNNPNWLMRFKHEHDRKCKRCKVHIFPINKNSND